MQNSLFQEQEQAVGSQQIKIFIVDDQQVVRAKLEDILSIRDDIAIVGMFDNAERAIAKIELLKPDVILMDIEMPKMDGIQLTQILSQRFPQSKVLILSTHKEEEYAQKSIHAGASGYIFKQSSAKNLVQAIHTVHQGYSHFGLNTLRAIQSNLSNADDTASLANSEANFKVKNSIAIPLQKDSKVEKIAVKEVASASTSTPALPTVQVEEFLPSIGKWINWGAMIVVTALAIAIPATSVLKYKTKIKTNATVRPVGETHIVQSATQGKIIEVAIKQGQEVKSGDIIAKIDSSRLSTQKNQLSKAIDRQGLILNQLNYQIAIVESQVRVETENNQAQLLAAQAELEGIQTSYNEDKTEARTRLRNSQAEVKVAEARLAAAKSRLQRYQSVGNIGALSQEQVAEAQLEVDQEEQAIQSANANLEFAKASLHPSSAAVEVAQQNINQARKSGQASIARLNQEKEALVQQRITIEQQQEQDKEELTQVNIDLENTQITAAVDGIISNLELRNSGQFVQPGQEIAQIIPSNAALEVKVVVSSQDISKIENDQRVQMRISACSYTDYGILEGRVSEIANDTRLPENNANTSASQSAPAFYEVSVTPDKTSLVNGKETCSLKLGMEGTAEIITKEESVMKFMLRKARLISNI